MGLCWSPDDHHPCFGIEMTSNLNWGKLSTSLTSWEKQIAFLDSLDEISENVQKLLKQGLCCSSVWDPHTQKHVKDIEGIQRRAAIVNGCYARVPGTVINLLNEL